MDGSKKQIDIDDLPKHSPWVGRLLGMERFSYSGRTEANVLREYDKEKFKQLINFCKKNTRSDFKSAHDFYFGIEGNKSTCVSQDNEIFLTSTKRAYKMLDQAILENVSDAITKCDVVVDLACGYGHNLHVISQYFPKLRYLGGDFSQNGLILGRKLFGNKITFSKFNFYHKKWDIFNLVKKGEKALVMTCYGVEQLPSAKCFLDTMQKYQDKICAVVNFEPLYDSFDESSILGLLRRRYIEINDYNQDLLKELKKRKRSIGLSKVETDIIGVNPLHPIGAVHWRFKK